MMAKETQVARDFGAITTAIEVVIERIFVLAEQDEELRSELRTLGEALIEIKPTSKTPTDHVPIPSPPIDEPTNRDGDASPVHEGNGKHRFDEANMNEPLTVDPPETGDIASLLSMLTLGTKVTPVPVEERLSRAGGDNRVCDADLALIEQRCRTKAEGCRWAAERSRLVAEEADFRTEIDPFDREIIERAKRLPDCHLWMCSPNAPAPDEDSWWEDVAVCFDTLANDLALICRHLAELEHDRAAFEEAMELLAASQSALREQVRRLGRHTDPDQDRVFGWLKSTAASRRIYVRRHMRLEDSASPTELFELEERRKVLEEELSERRKCRKYEQSRFKKAKYHLRLIAEGRNPAYDWGKVIEAIDEAIREGTPPSHPEIRDMLLPVVGDLPDFCEFPAGFRLTLREIDEYQATRLVPDEALEDEQPTDEVRHVARLLKGKTVLMIGGCRRPYSQEGLRSAFGLKDLIWISTREHQSIEGFEPSVARTDVAVVLLAIRWSSHSFEGVKVFCERHDKPLVRLPGGYGVNQVAIQILSQSGERLQQG